MVFFAFLPKILETQITKQVSKNLNLENFEFNIKKMGLFNTIAGDIKTGQSIEIDSIDIDYSFNSILQRRIKKVRVSGLTIKINVDQNNQIGFDDFDINRPDPNPESSPDADFLSLPFLPEKIEIKNSKIIANLISKQASQQIILPFETISVIKPERKTIIANMVLIPLGEKINIHATIDIGKGINNVRIDSKAFKLCNLLQLLEPFAPDIKGPDSTRFDIKADILFTKEKLKAHGKLGIFNPYTSPVTMNFKSSLNIQNFDDLIFEAENQQTENIKVSYNSQDILIKKPSFKIILKGKLLKAAGEVLIKSEKAETTLEDKKIDVNKIKFTSIFNYDFTKADKPINIATKANFRQIDIDLPGHKIKIKGVNAKLPFAIPFKSSRQKSSGRFDVAKCTLDNNYELKVNGSLSQIKTGLSIKGKVSIPDIENFILTFASKAMISPANGIDVQLDLNSKPYTFSSNNLAKFIPEPAKTINFALNLSSEGEFQYSSKGIKSYLKIDISEGNVSMPENKLFVNGLATSLELSNLLTLKSKPAQVLTIDSIKQNDIIMNKAIIKYNIESMDSLFIESTKIKWCNGIVSSEAVRLPNKNNNYTIIFYCDRLELTEILEQIGAFHAEGKGTMSGRIPVTYTDGEIAFDNGFLFSTPGKGGKIIIDRADKLTDGIPMDTPQFSQLDLAKEALKNYDYKWAKLNFNTLEDTLLVNMQFDGKPSKKVLPFEYRRELGRFVRVDASHPGSHFQGIKLDVNLKLPFNQVMKFGNKLKEAFK